MCNFQYVLLIDSNYNRNVLRKYEFFILRLPFIDDDLVDSDSEKYFGRLLGFSVYVVF